MSQFRQIRRPLTHGKAPVACADVATPPIASALSAEIAVFTDFRFVASATPTGVGKHIERMVSGLASAGRWNVRLLIARDQAELAQGAIEARGWSELSRQRLPLPWKVADGLWTATGRPFVDGWCGSPDWIYCPKNDFIPARRTRTAVTLHGAPELDPRMAMPRDFKSIAQRLRRRTSYRRIVERADLLLVVSEFLATQAIEWFGADRRRIAVVGNGAEDIYFRAGSQRSGFPAVSGAPSLLCVGGLNHLDGGDRVLALAKLLRESLPEVQVRVAGSQHDAHLERMAGAASNVKLLGYLPASQLAAEMQRCFALFLPTRYETFGIASVEAMAAGLPVITCRSTAIPEIVGDAGIYVDADDEGDSVDAVRRLLEDPEGWRVRSTAGRQRAQRFTWAACVERLHAALGASL